MTDVGMRDLRNNLSDWIQRAGREDVIVNRRGRAVARITSVGRSRHLDELILAGIVQAPVAPRETLTPRTRVRARGSVSELVAEQRR